MINYTVDSQKTLVLTEAELKILEDLLATHDRAGYYIAYNAMVDEGLLSFNGDQASLQARISTFSGPAGGSAFVAERFVMYRYGETKSEWRAWWQVLRDFRKAAPY